VKKGKRNKRGGGGGGGDREGDRKSEKERKIGENTAKDMNEACNFERKNSRNA
jgi:hypothetical protein